MPCSRSLLGRDYRPASHRPDEGEPKDLLGFGKCQLDFLSLLLLEEEEIELGFADLQEKRELRLNLLRWATEMGDGVCGNCLERHS